MIRGKQLSSKETKNTALRASIHNRFDIEVRDSQTGELRQKAKAENVICNSFWTRWFKDQNVGKYIHYGSGSGTPSVADTSLFSFVGAVETGSAETDYTHYNDGYIAYKSKITLTEKVAVGVVITEVGLASGTTSGSLTTHAMLQDMNGNPISIEKTDTDIITIHATRFLHWNTDGYDGMYVVPSQLISWSWVGSGLPTSIQLKYSRGTPDGSYDFSHVCGRTVNASKRSMTFNAPRAKVGEYNIGGILALAPGPFWMKAPHTEVIGEAVGTGDGSTTDFAVAFTMPYNATVYVDGVPQTSGVTVYPEPLLYNEMGAYFYPVDSPSVANPPVLRGGFIPVYSNTCPEGRYSYCYNPFYERGLAKFSVSSSTKVQVACSDDFRSWASLSAGAIPEQYQHYKYWRFYATMSSNHIGKFELCDHHNGKAIHFDTPPAKGSVITASYTVPGIAKDSNHVYDFQFTITFGEYSGEGG